MTRALVGARRMLDVLAVERHVVDPAAPAAEPPPDVPLADARSGVVVEPGVLTCIVVRGPTRRRRSPIGSAASSTTTDVTLGGVRLADLPVEACAGGSS